MNKTNEKIEKIKLATDQGETYELALEKMKEEDVHASIEFEDYIISVCCEKAEGMYMQHDNDLRWMIPHREDNQHVEIVVQDKDDKRFLPGLNIFCTLYNEKMEEIAILNIPFIWHPFLFHYGMNCKIPGKGSYTVKVTVLKPMFHRHDEVMGKRYQNDVTVVLGPLILEPGRKEYGPE